MGRRASAPAPAAAAPADAGGPESPAPAAPTPGRSGASTSGGRSTSTGRQWNAPGWAPTAGGIVLGALADVLFVQYMRGGWGEVRAWFSAKFLNNVTKQTAAGSVGSTIGQGAQLLGSIYGGAGGGSAGLAGGAPSRVPPGGPAKGTL